MSKQRVGKFFLQAPGGKYKTYRICWFDPLTKQTRGVATGTADRAAAQDALAAHQLKQGTEQLKDEPVLDSLNRYWLQYAKNIPSADSVLKVIERMTPPETAPGADAKPGLRAIAELGAVMVSQMDLKNQWKLLTAWREDGLADATIDRTFTTIWAAMNFGAENQALESAKIPERISRKRWNPVRGQRSKVLTVAELAKLFDAAGGSYIPNFYLTAPSKKYTCYQVTWFDPVRLTTLRRSTGTTDPVIAERRRQEMEIEYGRTCTTRFVDCVSWRFLILCLGTASRPQALCDLKAPQVDFEHGILDLNPPGRTQTSKYRPIIAMAPTLGAWLKDWAPLTEEGHYLGRAGRRLLKAKHIFKTLEKATGIKATPYTIRHTVATWLASKGVSVFERDSFMGHKRPSEGNVVGKSYTHYEPTYLRNASEAIEKLFETVGECTHTDLMRRGAQEDQPEPPTLAQQEWIGSWLEAGPRFLGGVNIGAYPEREVVPAGKVCVELRLSAEIPGV